LLNKLFLFITICFSTEINAQNDESYFPDLIGTWLTENKKQKVKVSYNPNTKLYTGQIIWMYEDDSAQGRKLLDSKNPDIKLQHRRVTGVNLIYQLKPKSSSKFKGYIYDPISGKDYSCNLKLSADRKTVEIRAYIFSPIIGRTELATKINE
jgi:uncharacterized protein (DUF2147 family)